MAVKITSTPLSVTVAISGEIDHHNAAAMRYEADDAIRASLAPNVRLDFGDVTFMDSSALASCSADTEWFRATAAMWRWSISRAGCIR